MNNSFQEHSSSFQNFANGISRWEISLYLFALTVLGNLFFVLLVTWFSDPMTGTTEYKEIAKNIAQGNGFVLKEGEEYILWRPPLYVYILSGFYYLFHKPYFAIVAFQVVLNALTGVMVFRIGEKIFHRGVGIFAALLLLAYPLFTYNCLRLMPEAIYSFFLSGIVFLSLDFFSKPNWKFSVVQGLFLSCATLLKAAIQFLPIFYFLFTIFFIKGWERKKKVIRNIGILVIIMGCAIAPWTIRNYKVSKEFILLDTSGGYTFWIGNRIASNGYDDDPLTEEEFEEIKEDLARILGIEYSPSLDVSKSAWASGANSSKLYREGIKGIMDDPFETFLLGLKKVYRIWFSYIGESSAIQMAIFILQTFILLPACLGLYFAFKDEKPIMPIALIIIYFSLLHMAATANVRYSVPLVPYVMILAVYGVSQFKRLARSD